MGEPAMPPPPAQELPGQMPPPYPGPPVQSQPLQPGYAAQPPPTYPPQQHAQTTMATAVVVTQQPFPTVTTVTSLRFGDYPLVMQCPTCHNQITTSVTREKGMMVWLMMGIICLLGFWMGCCLIPLCIPSCHDSIHSCPVCKTTLGECKKLN